MQTHTQTRDGYTYTQVSLDGLNLHWCRPEGAPAVTESDIIRALTDKINALGGARNDEQA